MFLRRPAALVAASVLLGWAAAPAGAEPEPPPEPGVEAADVGVPTEEVPSDAPAAPEAPAAPDVPAEPAVDPVVDAAPVDDGRIESAPPATSISPDGWTLTVGARDEFIKPIAPLTTAISSRDYEVAGVFDGSLGAPGGDVGETPEGVLEVGYQVGCGIDMSTSNGVLMSGSVGMTPSLGLLGIDVTSPMIDGIAPVLSVPVSGSIAVALKPGIINVVPVSKKQYRGFDPWVSISGFHIKIDGCVGESFIRSYAVLTRSTDVSDAIQAYYGTTKKV